MHRYTISGRSGRWLGRGWRCDPGGRVRRQSEGSRRSPDGRVGVVNATSFCVTVVDVAHRSTAVQRCRRLDVPEGVDADGWRPDRELTSPARPTVACSSRPRPLRRRPASLRRRVGIGLAPLTPGRLMDTREGQSTVDGQFAGIGVRAANSIDRAAGRWSWWGAGRCCGGGVERDGDRCRRARASSRCSRVVRRCRRRRI